MNTLPLTKMTEISIRYGTGLVYYTIQKGDWIWDGDALTLDAAFEMIKHNLEHDYYRPLSEL